MSREEKKEFYQNRARENRRLEKNRDLNAILKDVASEQPGYGLVWFKLFWIRISWKNLFS